MLIVTLLIILLSSSSVLAQSSSSCGSPTTAELVNKTFIDVPGCRAGEEYQTTTLVGKCTCWYQAGQKCGYICDKAAIPVPGSVQPVLVNGGIILRRKTVLGRVRRQAACPPSPLPANSRWVASNGCIVGTNYSISSEICTCCGNVGYICTLKNPSTTTAAPTPTTTAAATTTTVASTITTTTAPTTTSTTTAVPTTSTTAPTTTTGTTTTAAPVCPPSPFPSNAAQYIADPGCTVLAATTTQAIVISGGTLACICTSPVKCGMLCYSLQDGSNPSG